MPLVYTRVEGGVATEPLPIHRYLGACEGSQPEEGPAGGECDDEPVGSDVAGAGAERAEA